MKIVVSLLAVFVTGTNADALSGFGSVATMAGSFVPAEFRGITGTIAAAALQKQFKAKGLVDFATDGSDYPFVCLCATPAQLKQLIANGNKDLKADKCPEKQDMGCQQPQVDMTNAPLPVIASPAPR
jgi:hypothetical protein